MKKIFLVLALMVTAGPVWGGANNKARCSINDARFLSQFFGGVKNWTQVIPGSNQIESNDTIKVALNFNSPQSSVFTIGGSPQPAQINRISVNNSCNKINVDISHPDKSGTVTIERQGESLILTAFVYRWELKPSNRVRKADIPQLEPLVEPEAPVVALNF